MQPSRNPRLDNTTPTGAATLTARDAPEHGTGWRYIEVDCPHATTASLAQNPEQAGITEELLVRVLLLRHYDEEGCSCTKRLRERYGLRAARKGGRA